MLDNAKRTFLFIGMIVGAGFATGRELMLYFYGKSLLTIILAGLIMGIVYGVFLKIGASGTYQYMKNTLLGKLMSYVMGISLILSFVVVTAGAEELLLEIFDIRFLGVVTGAITAIIAPLGIRRIKNINLIIVPLLILTVIILSAKSDVVVQGKFSLSSSIAYVGMNMLMGGYLVLEGGEKVSNKDILISSSMVAIIFTLLLVILVRGVWAYPKAYLPVYALSIARGLPYIGGLMMYLAILSTMMGSAKLIYDNIYDTLGYRCIAVLFVMFISIMSYFVDFENLVNLVYSIEGVVGVIFVGYVVVSYIFVIAKYNKTTN